MSQFLKGNNKFSAKFATLVLLVSPILGIYGWGTISFSIILFFIVFIFNWKVFFTPPPSLNNYFGLYFIYFILTKIVYANTVYDVFPKLFILYSTIIFAYTRLFDLKIGLKLYRVIAFVCIIFFLFQEYSYYTLGMRPSGIISFLPLNIDYINEISSYIQTRANSDRSSSFFSEPSYFAQFLLPLLILELFIINKRTKINIVSIFLILVTLLLLQSGGGIIGLSLVIMGYVATVIRRNLHKFLILIPLISITAAFFILNIVNSKYNFQILNRGSELSGEIAYSSGFVRVYRGYYVFKEYPLIQKIFGINNPESLNPYINKSEVSSFFYREGDQYFNTIQLHLLFLGFTGLCIFFLIIRKLYIKNSLSGKMIILLYCLLSFMEYIYLNNVMTLYFILAYSLKEEEMQSIIHNKKS